MRQELECVLFEALVVSTLGLIFALVANFASPRGLLLTRNYFPGPNTSGVDPGANSSLTVTAQKTDRAGHATWETVSTRLRGKGLQPIDGKEALELFSDPQYEREMIVFVDARDDRHYQEGHVPGAYQFDPYYPEEHLLAVLPACLNATKVVVYCAGGDCEDSEFAALALIEAGIPQERLFIYAGGMTEWATNGVPIEYGERKSGNLQPAKP
jgi:rhodanese-related sulfurtransferase